MPEPPAHQALMEEIARLEDLAREWIGLFPQAGRPGPALAEGAVPGPGPRGGGHLPPGGGGRGEIRQEHHDQRPGGPGPVAPGRRDPHGHGHPGPTRPGSRRRCSGSRGGTKSTGRSAGPWGCCPIPGWWTGPSPWTCRRPRTGNSWPRSWPRPGRPTSGPAAAWIRTTCCSNPTWRATIFSRTSCPPPGRCP